MNILITGTSSGIGKRIAERFLTLGHTVYGVDIEKSSIDHENYVHIIADITDADSLPDVSDVAVLINNAGVQNSSDDINVNLKGTINVTEKYTKDGLIDEILSSQLQDGGFADSHEECSESAAQPIIFEVLLSECTRIS